ncbi:MAG: PhoD-like phosphatase [Waterburya sp.]
MTQPNSAIQFLPKLEQLPLIIAGPMVRHVQPDTVTIWIALKQPELVCLKVFSTESGKGSKLTTTILQGEQQTIPLGQNLHVLAITASPINDTVLIPNHVYAYDLAFKVAGLNLPQSLSNDSSDRHNSSISYFPHQLPTFALPPQDLNCLRIVHGSCRKPHGGGKDTLSCLDNLIQDVASIAHQRPHQLFMTGDQIYGDDVADPMLWLCQGVSQLLFGWSEALPLESGSILSEDLPPGKRATISQLEGGMTAMLQGKADKAKSHLLSFAEYAAAYLIAWSPVLIPQNVPNAASLGIKGKQAKVWQSEIAAIDSFWQDLGLVRRALANIPVYTICDDHDVSDDWYLNREWCDRVLSKPLGKRTVQNALLTYAIFQAWGNTPHHFIPGSNGAKLLQVATRWLASAGQDSQAKAECDRYLGIPPNDPITHLPQYQPDKDVEILARKPEAIPWHYTLMAGNHEVIVLDTRTWRGYPPEAASKLKPPMLLSPIAFQKQLQQPLADQPHKVEATLVVLPTNFVALGAIDRIQRYEFSRGRAFSTDVGDSWNFHETAFITLLLNLCQQRDRVIILSGDIHYSCAVRLVHWDYATQNTSVIVQLTSSAIKNSEFATRVIHTRLKSLFPEPTQRWIGWNHPRRQTKLPQTSWWLKPSPSQQNTNPDWQYRIEWVKRQPIQSMPWREAKAIKATKATKATKSSSNLGQSTINQLIKILSRLITLLWRNSWVQEGAEVVGRNNLSLVRFNWPKTKSATKKVIQETYWHPPWQETRIVKSRYEVVLEDPLKPSRF